MEAKMKKLFGILAIVCMIFFATTASFACDGDCKCGCKEGKPCTCKKVTTDVAKVKCACGKENCTCDNCKCKKKILGIFKRKCKCSDCGTTTTTETKEQPTK